MSLLLALLFIGSALTLLAVPTMGEQKADLTLDTYDIHFSDSEPEKGDNITIYVTVNNDGEAGASNILVMVKDLAPGKNETTSIGNETIRELDGGKSTNLSFIWTADPAGNHKIIVELDPEDTVDETNETNNDASRTIHVKTQSSEDGTFLQGYTKRLDNSEHIPHVDVRIAEQNGTYSDTIRSDKNGWYEFELDTGGDYFIEATREGYQDYNDTLTVKDNQTTTYHIRMEANESSDETAVHGYVYEKESRGGTPIHGAEITITGESTNHTYYTYSNRDGYYEKQLEHEDNYTITAEAEGYHSQTVHKYIAEGKNESVNFHLEKKDGEDKTILKGYTKKDSDSSHIAYVSIQVNLGNYSKTTTSSGEGYYEFELEHNGTYNVQAEKDGYEDFEGNVTVREGETTTYYIRMTAKEESNKTRLYGSVYESNSRGDTPINEAEITITGHSVNETYTTYTNRDGYYEQDLEGEDNYTIVAEKEGYESVTKHQYVQRNHSEQVNFYLEKKGGSDDTILEGYVKDKTNGTHLSYVNVTLHKGGHHWSTYSNGEGYYEFSLDEGGNYTIVAKKESYEEYEYHIHLKPNDETVHYIKMEKSESQNNETWIYGYITENGTERPIDDALVIITTGGRGNSTHTYSNSSGYYEKKLYYGSNYSVEVKKDGFLSQEKHVYLEEGDETRLDFELVREVNSIILKGYVKEYTSRLPIAGFTITVYGLECNCSYATETDSHGYYEIVFDIAGNYTLFAHKSGYESGNHTFFVDDSEPYRYDLYLRSLTTTFYGYVYTHNSRGSGINDVNLTFFLEQRHYSTLSNQYGYYEQDLDHGGYVTIEVSKKDYESITKTVTITTGESKRIDFYLEPSTEGSGNDPLFMVKENKLSTTLPDGGETQVFTALANFEQNTPVSRVAKWAVVGTWSSSPIDTDTRIEGELHFNLWYKIADEGYNGHPDWKFELLHNGVAVTHILYEDGHANKEETEMMSTMVKLAYPIEAQAGDTFGMRIHYRHVENVDIYYGTEEYNSSVILDANPDFDEKQPIEKFGVEISSTRTSIELEGTEITVISLTLHNTGQVQDTYQLSVIGNHEGWNVSIDSPYTVTLEPGETNIISLSLMEGNAESDSEIVVVEVVATSMTYPEVYDSVRIEASIKVDDSGIPDLTIPLITASIAAGALVASFRRRF